MDISEACFLAAENTSETRFKALHGTVSVGCDSLSFWGAPGVGHLVLAAGRHYDLTCGVGGADRLYISGKSDAFRVRVLLASNGMTLTHLTTGTQVKLHASRGPKVIVFHDGAIDFEALWQSASQSAALLNVLGAPHLAGKSAVSDHISLSPHQAATCQLPDGAMLQVVGRKGVETVYVPVGAPAVVLDGARIDYRANVHGPRNAVLTLGRNRPGGWQISHVVGLAKLLFSDGVVLSSAVQFALKSEASWPPADGPSLPSAPRISAISLDCSAPSQGLGSSEFSTWHAGQVLEISVSFCQSVLVTGAPNLQLQVSGQTRMAVYGGGSGTNTLRFIYWLTAYDAAQLYRCDVSARQLLVEGLPNFEVGPIWPCGALIVPLFSPIRLRSDGATWSLIDCAAWTNELDIDLSELERGGELDLHAGDLECDFAHMGLTRSLQWSQ